MEEAFLSNIVLEGVKFGHQANQEIIRLQEQIVRAAGKPKLPVPDDGAKSEVVAALGNLVDERLDKVLSESNKDLREKALRPHRRGYHASRGGLRSQGYRCRYRCQDQE